MLIVSEASAKRPAVTAPRSDSVDVRKNLVLTEHRAENVINEAFLGLAFSENVKSDQREGLPPTTFFSHSSDSV